MKTQVRRFLHDCDMRRDPKVLALCEEYGNTEGYAYFCWFLEALREQSNHQLANRPLILSKITFIPEGVIGKFILSCKKLGLLQETSEHYIECSALTKRVLKYDSACEAKKVKHVKTKKVLKLNIENHSDCLEHKDTIRVTNTNTNTNTNTSTEIGTSTELTTNVSTKSLTTENTNLVPILKEQKIKFGTSGAIELTESEIKKLETAFNHRKDVFDRAVFLLESWKQDNPMKAAKRKSDYRQLLNWPLRQAFEDVAKIKKYSNPIASMPFVPSAAERAEIRTEMAYEKFRTTKTKSAIEKMLDGEPLDEDLETETTNRRLAQ